VETLARTASFFRTGRETEKKISWLLLPEKNAIIKPNHTIYEKAIKYGQLGISKKAPKIR
jgi:hypothetical protein